ncbi:hypothetical protein JHK87_044902 [Glycine soja]|nr:hypothetical protein JHK87_044902 [Glycine soja]
MKITGVTLLRKLTFVPFAGFIVISMCFCFSLVDKFLLGFAFPLLLGLTVRRKGGLGVLQNGVGRCCVIFVCFSFQFESKIFVLQFSFAEVDWEKLSSGVRLVVRTKFSFAEFDREKLRVCDYKVMARVADKIKLIDGSWEALKLSVRITDLWFIGIPGKTEQAEMVVVDSDGDEIHVVCKQDQLKSRKADLKENLTYVMHNFKVIKNDGKFRVCDHEYKLCFTGVTVVRQCDMEQLPFRKFRFVAFSSVIAGHFKIGLLVDVIGVVDEVVFRYMSSKNTRVVLNLKDLSGQVLSCTLWENYCLQFLSYLNDIEDERPIVILLTHARIKEAQGIEVRSILTPIGQGSSQVSGSSQLSSKDVFLSKTEVKNISQINASSEDGDVDLNASPQALDRLLGCFLAFKVKVQPRFRNSVVLKYSDESDLINIELDMIPDSEQSLSITADHGRSRLGSSEPTEFESQSVSVTGDHDPLLRIPLTPTKRVSFDELDNERKKFQISPAEVSSNKLAKLSQPE